MKLAVLISLLLLPGIAVQAQSPDAAVKKGNDLYKKGDYDGAAGQYQKALDKDAKNNKALYNLGNAHQKQQHFADAAKVYDQMSAGADTGLYADALYNKGLAYVRERKFPEAVDAFKQSLRLAPADDHTRENLQKALNELKQQQQQQPPPNKQPPPQQREKNKKQPSPQPNESKLSKEQAEQLLSNLRENEKQLQKQLQKQKTPTTQVEKDW